MRLSSAVTDNYLSQLLLLLLLFTLAALYLNILNLTELQMGKLQILSNIPKRASHIFSISVGSPSSCCSTGVKQMRAGLAYLSAPPACFFAQKMRYSENRRGAVKRACGLE